MLHTRRVRFFGHLKFAFLLTVTGLWILSIGLGLRRLDVQANLSGDVGKLTLQNPKDSPIPLGFEHLPTLVVFLHPLCGSSLNTVGELDTLMAKTNSRANIYVVFSQPQGWSEDEVQGQLWKEINSIPGMNLVIDHDGNEAKRFGAKRSGHVIGFDSHGKLALSGGLQTGPGRLKKNEALRAAVDFVNTGKAAPHFFAVEGCSLSDPEKVKEKGKS